MANIHWCGLLGSLLLLIILDSSFGQTEKGRQVCEESQGEDEKKDARAWQSSGAQWVCGYVEVMIFPFYYLIKKF